MSLFRRLFSPTDSPKPESRSSSEAVRHALGPPDWTPPDQAAERLVTFAKRVARDLRSSTFPPARPGGDHWVVSYDVYEAVWWVADPRSWAAQHGQVRDGWSQGMCLLLFTNGALGQGYWFGEVDPMGTSIGIDQVAPPGLPGARWSTGNLARWRSGGGGLHPKAREHFKGFWPQPRTPIPPWAGTSMQLKRFLTEKRPQVPRYY